MIAVVLALAAGAWGGSAPPARRPALAVVSPRPRDGVWDAVSVSARAEPEAEFSVELWGRDETLLGQSTVRAAGESLRIRLPVSAAVRARTGTLRVRRAGQSDTAPVAIPLVFQRVLVRDTTRLLRSLGQGDLTFLKQWAGPAVYWLVVEGSNAPAENAPTTRRRLAPLLRWARKHGQDPVRQVNVTTNTHEDGYSAVTLKLNGGYLDVGVTFDGRLDKIFATRNGAQWD